MAPLVNEFKKYPEQFETIVCVTGQHRQMLDQVLSVFSIKPDFDLNIMQPDQDLYDVFSDILLKMRYVYEEVRPDLVLVHGDTTTSTASALAAFYQKIPVAHIEAGLRTNNIYSPFPEEINRQLTARLATWHFSPTNWSKGNLLKENIPDNKIVVTGNTVIDALRMIVKKINDSVELKYSMGNEIHRMGYDTGRLSDKRKLILITGHRRENFGEGFRNICEAIKQLAGKFGDFDFLYPVHFNPVVRASVEDVLGRLKAGNIFLIDPLDYLPFVYLMQKSYLILTDSGGIQEEAPEFGVPVLVMRDTTERPEALDAGTIVLVGTDKEKIIDTVSLLINNQVHYHAMANKTNPYGDGKASERIVSFFFNEFLPVSK
jgi:UDP-N-acetylglucosamine 2-epimerase (non-hydrolysing)